MYGMIYKEKDLKLTLLLPEIVQTQYYQSVIDLYISQSMLPSNKLTIVDQYQYHLDNNGQTSNNNDFLYHASE